MAKESDPKPEQEPISTQVILVRGLETLPGPVSDGIARWVDAQSFDSNWTEKESFEDKLDRFEEQVDEIKKSGKRVVVIGVSAGAGLSLCLMLKRPDLVDHLYSLSGVLDPNLNELDDELKPLTEPEENESFYQMCKHLTNVLHPNPNEFSIPTGPTEDRMAEAVKWNLLRGNDNLLIPKIVENIKDRITAWSSLGESDTVVPMRTRMPAWIEKPRLVGIHEHVGAIMKVLVFEVKKDIKEDQELLG